MLQLIGSVEHEGMRQIVYKSLGSSEEIYNACKLLFKEQIVVKILEHKDPSWMKIVVVIKYINL